MLVRRDRLRPLILAASMVLGLGAVAAPATADTAPTDTDLPTTVSADALPTVQIDGVAWKQVIVGDTVYVGGSFSSARPAGAAAGEQETPRANMLAYSLSTGELVDGFAPEFNGQVKDMALSADKSLLYVAGSFTSVDGSTRYRSAAIDLATGKVTSFRPIFNSTTNAVAVAGDAVVYGGVFSTADKADRSKVAAVSAGDTGTSVLPMDVEVTGGNVNDVVASPDGSQIVIGGAFTAVNGSDKPGYGLARIDVSTGKSMALPVNDEFRDAGSGSAVLSLETDGTSFYGTGYNWYGAGNSEGSFKADWANGELTWIEDCHGDTYDIWPTDGAVYQASHKHYCGTSGGFPETKPRSFHHSTAVTQDVRGTNVADDKYGYADHPGTPRPEFLEWYPKWTNGTYTTSAQATWTVTGNDDYVVYGGEFTKVNGTAQQGLVRFAAKDIAPNKVGPALRGSAWKLTAEKEPGTVTLTWPANPDKDNAAVTYKLYRDSEESDPIKTVKVDAPFWEQKEMTFTDTGLMEGTTKYRVTATDPLGNTSRSEWVTVEVTD